MSYPLLAFFMGLFGSIHCAVMCGPLMLALPQTGQSKSGQWAGRLLYQGGRIISYGLLGVLLAGIGQQLSLQGWQQSISLVTGGLLLVVGIFQLIGIRSNKGIALQQRFLQPVIKGMGFWLYRPGGSFLAGMLNGFLPCGMVYMALLSAVNASSIAGGGWFMMCFGLGTLPILLTITSLGHWVKKIKGKSSKRYLPYLMIVMGIWFLLRGANLDIPYLSPLLYPEGAIHCA
jgi:sulfite exporter TauE/SafE